MQSATWLQNLEVEDLANVRKLALQYHARLGPRSARFQWPSNEALLRTQGRLVEGLGLATGSSGRQVLSSSRGDAAYTCTFLKELIARIEAALASRANGNEENDTVDDELYDMFATLMMQTGEQNGQSQSMSVVHFFPSGTESRGQQQGLFPLWDTIKVTEERATIVRGTTGLKTWEAALRLAQHCVLHKDDFQGRRILELGCGAGFLGVLLAKMQNGNSNHVTMTDLDGQVLERAQSTLDLNFSDQVPTNISLCPVDWFDVRDQTPAACKVLEDAQADVVLAADVVFDPELVDALAAVIARALRSKSRDENRSKPYALIASTVRNQQTYDGFLKALAAQELQVEEETMSDVCIDLRNLAIVKRSTDSTEAPKCALRLFPSLHDANVDGRVQLLKIGP